MASSAPVLFGKFTVTSSVFHTTRLSFAMVNLKPLQPGHVLVCPRRVAQRLTDLTTDEVSDLFLTVQRVSRMLERVYGATALNLGIQDGPDAGQSVPHVHTHLIPRRPRDMDAHGGNDALYGRLEGEEGNVGAHQAAAAAARKELWERERPTFPPVDDADRHPRSEEELSAEAQMLAKEMDKEKL